MKRTLLGCCLLVFTAANSFSRQGNAPVLNGPYYGQKPPGMTPEIFAPGVMSFGFHENGIAVSPDGTEIFFMAAGSDFQKSVIMHAELKNGAWTAPAPAPFSGKYKDVSPSFSRDGRRLYFASKRPLAGSAESKDDFDIWFIERKSEGWSEPLNLGGPINTNKHETNPTFMSDGTMIFQSMEKQGALTWDIYVSILENGKYATPQKLPSPVNTEFNEAGPSIAPDGSYLVFNSNRPHGLGIMSLFVSFKNRDGSWCEPVNLRNKLDSKPNIGDASPVLSPDGKYLFFMSFRNTDPIEPKSAAYYEEMKKLLGAPLPGRGTFYWVDARVIEELRPVP